MFFLKSLAQRQSHTQTGIGRTSVQPSPSTPPHLYTRILLLLFRCASLSEAQSKRSDWLCTCVRVFSAASGRRCWVCVSGNCLSRRAVCVCRVVAIIRRTRPSSPAASSPRLRSKARRACAVNNINRFASVLVPRDQTRSGCVRRFGGPRMDGGRSWVGGSRRATDFELAWILFARVTNRCRRRRPRGVFEETPRPSSSSWGFVCVCAVPVRSTLRARRSQRALRIRFNATSSSFKPWCLCAPKSEMAVRMFARGGKEDRSKSVWPFFFWLGGIF